MTIFVFTRDPALEEQVHVALDRAGWPSASLPAGSALGQLPGASALVVDAACAATEALDPALPIILLLADGAVSALAGNGGRAARVIVRKPFTQRALENAVRCALPPRSPRSPRPLALDPAMRAVCAQLEALAATSLSVVLSGETGTGKTHLARWLHSQSPRAQRPLVEVAAGAAAGSLDGAPSEEPGAIERAHGGSLLIEDVAELPLREQLSLLRFLVDRTSEGGVPVDARVIATTRNGLAGDAREGRLQLDLAARLAAAELALPPLRSRPLELAPFARSFAERAALAAGVAPPLLDEAASASLRRLALPGNLHELENLMQRAVLLAPGRALDTPALRLGGAAELTHAAPRAGDEVLDLRTLERRAIERALAHSRGDRMLAARALGIHVRTLRNKLRADVH